MFPLKQLLSFVVNLAVIRSVFNHIKLNLHNLKIRSYYIGLTLKCYASYCAIRYLSLYY